MNKSQTIIALKLVRRYTDSTAVKEFISVMIESIENDTTRKLMSISRKWDQVRSRALLRSERGH